MLRISTTTIESFRRVMQTEYASEQNLIAQVKGIPFEATWQMDAGTAWDRIIQEPPDLDEQNQKLGRYLFDAEAVIAAQRHIGKGISQVKNTLQFDTAFGPAIVVGVADHVRGLVVQEHKAKFSQPDPKSYETSLQWRFYCLLFGAACVRYNLFSFNATEQGYCELMDIVSFRFWPYVGLEADCLAWLNDFLHWVHERHLMKYLER